MTTSASPEPSRPRHRHRDTRRGLVVRPCDHVDRRVALWLGCTAGIGFDDDRVADERVLGDRGRELRAEFAVAQVQRPLVDQPERRGVPERRRPAVAQHHLVAVGHREEVPQPVAHPADQIFHRRLPVRRAEKRGGAGGKRLQLFGSDLRRAGSEASVAGFDVVGNRELVSHDHQVSDPAEADDQAVGDASHTRPDVT